MAQNIGTIYVELDLDRSRYTKSQQQLYKDATTTALKIEDNFKKLGIKSSAEFDLMRAKAKNAFEAIANSSKVSANDRLRAEKALSDQLKRIHNEQYNYQKGFFGKIKSDLAAVASSSLGTAAIMTAAFTGASVAIKAAFDKGFKYVATIAARLATDLL